MAAGKSLSLFLVFLGSTTVFSYSYVREASGRRLFGGYRIVPKTCKPTIPSRVKSNEPAICMFNYECTRRNGEVVGACMDGFLFGACCQLPPKSSINDGLEKITSMEDILNPHEIDHVPDIPILLNPDGTPVGMKIPQSDNVNKEGFTTVSKHPTTEETIYSKITTFGAPSTTKKPIVAPSYNMDSVENAEKPQIPVQPDLTNLEENFSALLNQQSILDDLSLPSLLSHSDSNNDIQDHQENSPVNPVTTLLSPDEILQIADPVDQLPALFSQGLGQSNYSSADTILLNKNGSVLNEVHNPDDLFKPTVQTFVYSTEKNRFTQSFGTSEKGGVTESESSENKKKVTLDANHRDTTTTQWVRFPEQERPSSINSMTTFGGFPSTKLPMITQMYGNSQGIATISPESLSTMLDKFEKISTIEERVSTKDVEALYSLGQKTTTPMSTLSDKKEDLVRVPTITYDAPSGNKKHDIVDKEEIAINHIISILNDTTPGSDKSVTVQAPNSPIHTWVSIDEHSKPTLIKLSSSRPTPPTSVATQSFPYTFYKPNQPTNYYNYETVPTETSYTSHSTPNTYPPRPSTQTNFGSSQSNFGYSTRPTTNPPAPTVIVLGPLGTEYTTETTEKSVVTRKPTTEPVRLSSTAVRPTVGSIRPSLVSTKKPTVSTTITHNISTVISNVATNNNHVVSSSFISVNLKDGSTSKPTISTAISTEAVSDEESEERITTRKPIVWTTLSSWSDKPLFQLKPSTSTFRWPEENPTASDSVIFGDSESAGVKATTSTPPCDDETAAPDDLINFPPVRNPNLNISAPISQQEKPIMIEGFNDTRFPDVEIISENDIPTPTFIEDDVLTNKVDAFVNKLVESLQGNFQDLKDVVYKRNSTTTATPTTVTKRPTVTRKPTQKPTQTAKPPNTSTKRPVTTRRPATRPASPKPTSEKPTSEKPPRTSKPTTSKPRPTTSYGVTTKKPQVTTKRSKPTKKPTTTTTRSTEALLFEEEATSPLTTAEDVNASSQATPTVDFRNQCGVRPLVKSGRIVGGKAASFGKWPWQVLVREATWLGLFTKNKCGGVLITDKYVITAAHCQPGFLASLVAVFGEFDLSGELEDKRSMTRNVRRVIVNRGYDPATFESDLALLELESPVQFDEHIVPICMPDDNIDFTGRMATVTGWGRLKYNGGVPFLLQEVQVPIIKNSVCQEMFQIAGHSKLIVDSFLCAGYADGQKDSCEGDSGGPLVMQRPDGRWFLVGTVSHGIKCASPFLPGVYMRINYFKPWLHSVTGV